MNIKTTLLATVLATFGAAASAATFNVVDNPGGQVLATENGIANFGTFSQTLMVDDSVSVTFEGNGMETLVGVGFSTSPVDAGKNFELVFTSTDFSTFGVTDVHLSTSTSIADAFASGTISGAFVGLTLSGSAAADPFYLLYELSAPTNGSFTGDLSISAVPLPAGILLLGTALGGLGIARRRNKA